MRKTQELMPCPFCGGEAHLESDSDGSAYTVVDHKASCFLSDYDTRRWFYGEGEESPEDIAASEWNQRAERMCCMRFDTREYRYRCSRCGCLSETYRSTDGKWYAPEYCTACGARVVERGGR